MLVGTEAAFQLAQFFGGAQVDHTSKYALALHLIWNKSLNRKKVIWVPKVKGPEFWQTILAENFPTAPFLLTHFPLVKEQ